MALLHRATLSPTKLETIAAWLPTQRWASSAAGEVELVGAFRFDDPQGLVGIECHLVSSGGTLLHVPVTYRDAPLADAEEHLLGTMEHSVLGERWVYDGLHDAVYVTMLAAVAMTGTGQAVSVVAIDGRTAVLPSLVKLVGGGWEDRFALIDEFVVESDDDAWSILRNDRFELRVARRPIAGEQPSIGLTAQLPGHDDRVILAEVRPQ